MAHRMLGEYDSARQELGESLELARAAGDLGRVSAALTNLAIVEIDVGMPDGAIPILQEAISLDRGLDDPWAVAVGQTNLAGALISAGRATEAHRLLDSIAANVAALGDVEMMAVLVELLAMALAERGADRQSAALSGTAEVLRERGGVPTGEPDQALIDRFLGPARLRLGSAAWQGERAAGRELTAAEAVDLARFPVEPHVP